jgi:phospholipase/carboxylesterase
VATALDGPRCGSASGKTTSLVVFLHGFGANGDDLFGLARSLAPILPNTAFASPNAPEPCELGGPGLQWFGLIHPDGPKQAWAAGADLAAPLLSAYLAAELARYGLDRSRLALVGFSQGTMMALHVGLAFGPPVAAIVGFSGRLIAPAQLKPHPDGRPPILLIHGDADTVVPSSNLEAAALSLRAVGLKPETLLRPGLAHGIDEPGLVAAAQFLVQHLPPDVVA